MTRDEIMAMEAGPEMDKAVARQVTGWSCERDCDIRRNGRCDGSRRTRCCACGRDGHGNCYGDGAGPVQTECCERLPPYSTDIAAAWEVEAHVATLANYMGKIVPHVVRNGNSTTTSGCCLREKYVTTLLRVVCPDIGEYAITCMGSNNWLERRFRSDELWALAHATPLQRCRAALLATLAQEPA